MKKIERLLSVLKKKVVFIQTHNYPDQDALATAQGLKILLEHYGKQAVVCYKGEIDKYNTIKMIELLKLDIVPIDTIEFQPNDEIILVDCQQGNSNLTEYNGNIVACIDHHKLQDQVQYLYSDIRPDVGACATIIATYFTENNIPMDPLLSTTLTYGIRMDTSMLSRSVSDLDLKVYCDLYKTANHQILRQLDTCTLKLKDLDMYYNAIANLKMYGSLGFIDLGENCSESLMGQISDFMLTLREIDIVVTHSYRDDGVKFTVRSNRIELDACNIIQIALDTFGDGGGHATMAAGFVPNIPNHSVALKISSIAEERITNYVCEKLNWPKEKKIRFKKIRQLLNSWTPPESLA